MRVLRVVLAVGFGLFLAIPLSLPAQIAPTARDTVHVAQQKVPLDSVRLFLVQYCGTSIKSQTARGKAACRNYGRLSTNEASLIVGPAPVPPTPIPPTPIPIPPDTTHAGFVAPALPRVFLNTAESNSPSNGRSLRVGTDVQAALDSAQCGDKVLLPASATLSGNYFLRKTCTAGAWITIRTDGCATLPAEGVRVSVAAASCYVKLVAADPTAPVFATTPGAAYYRIIGVEATVPATATLAYILIRFGDSGPPQDVLSEVPDHFILDRVYLHGNDVGNLQRCVALNSSSSAVIDSYISKCHYKGADAQAIVAWNSPGPFKIVNNYLEASGENILFGGADPSILNLNPADAEVRHNHLIKPLSWKGVWTAKNLFEIKNGVRILLEGNVLENSWTDAQVGQGIVMQALSDNNTAAWTTVQDVTVRYNIVRNALLGAAIASRAAYGANGANGPLVPTQPSQRISFQHNLFENIGTGNLFNLSGDLQNASLIHNTSDGADGSVILMFDDPQKGFYMADNVFGHGWWGIYGNAVGEGWPALNKFAPGWVLTHNVLYQGRAGWPAWNQDLYPPVGANYFPATVSGVGFTNYPSDLSLTVSSPYKGKASDGKDPGVDYIALRAATAGVVIP